MALATIRNYDPFQAPTHFKLSDLLKKFDKSFNATGRNYGKVGKARTMEDAVQSAYSECRAGDAVLLSPACASYDMFRSYVHRGQVFVAAVKALIDSQQGQTR